MKLRIYTYIYTFKFILIILLNLIPQEPLTLNVKQLQVIDVKEIH